MTLDLLPFLPFLALVLRVVIGLNFLIGRGIRHLFTERNHTVNRWKSEGIPSFAIHLAALLNFFGAISLIIGFLVPIAAFFFSMEMIVTTLLHRYKLNSVYFGHGKGGYENNITYLLLFIVLIILGGGAYSVDALTGI